MRSYMHSKKINYVQCSKFPVEQISSNYYSACTDWSIQSYARGPQCNAERSQASFIGCVTGEYVMQVSVWVCLIGRLAFHQHQTITVSLVLIWENQPTNRAHSCTL